LQAFLDGKLCFSFLICLSDKLFYKLPAAQDPFIRFLTYTITSVVLSREAFHTATDGKSSIKGGYLYFSPFFCDLFGLWSFI